MSTGKLSEKPDCWKWNLDDKEEFSVGNLRRSIADREDGEDAEDFEWINWLPIKVNCFVWKMKQNRIPVASNLVTRGVRIDDICGQCSQQGEDVNHVFFSCNHAKEVWRWFIGWTKLMQESPTNFSSLTDAVNSGNKDMKTKKMLWALVYVAIWLIWKDRNDAVFKNRKTFPMKTADEIQLVSYNWITLRAKRRDIKWYDWCNFPSMNV